MAVLSVVIEVEQDIRAVYNAIYDCSQNKCSGYIKYGMLLDEHG